MISGRGRTITYDGANRPVTIDAVSFVYGPDGARLKKTAGGVTTLFLGADVEQTAGVWSKYIHPDAMKVGAQSFWLHRDHLNSVRVRTNGIGAINQAQPLSALRRTHGDDRPAAMACQGLHRRAPRS